MSQNQPMNGNMFANGNGYVPYGGNFVDILFKHLLDKGLAGLTVMTILNLYLYLSLDKIKEFLKYINEKIHDYFKNQGQKYWSRFYQFIDKKIKRLCSVLMNILSRLLNRLCLNILYTNHSDPEPKKDNIIETRNSINVLFSNKNKLCLIALGNFIMDSKSIVGPMEILVENSDKNKHTVHYKVPNQITIDAESVRIDIMQNINLSIIAEKISGKIITKNIDMIIPKTNIINDTFSNFSSTVFTETHTITGELYKSNIPSFTYQTTTGSYNCSIENLFGLHNLIYVVMYTYYNKKYDMIKKFLELYTNGGGIAFMGINYQLSKYGQGLKHILDTFDSFKEVLSEFCETKFIPFFEKKKGEMENFSKKMDEFFKPIENVVYGVKMTFSSKDLICIDLESAADIFMQKIIDNYLYKAAKNDDNNISIYQLGIKYDTEIIRKKIQNI